MGSKKKLFSLNPKKEQKEIEVHKAKTIKENVVINMVQNENSIRDMLSNKISGTLVGLWMLVAEHLRIGSWDLLKGWTRNNQLDMRIGMQIINESALCVSGGKRPRNTLCNQGFEVLNGLSYIATDKQVHLLLDDHTIHESEDVQIALGKIRRARGDYKGQILALDPHRIETHSERIMHRKKQSSTEAAKKFLQTFFCVDAETKQPVFFKIGSAGQTITRATKGLVEMVKGIFPDKLLYLTDKEHFSGELIEYFSKDNTCDVLVPAPGTQKVKRLLSTLEYKEMWPGYAIAESTYLFQGRETKTRLIGQRFCDNPSDYYYTGFLTTSSDPAVELLTEVFPKRWKIEEFFNFEGALGWIKASTMNLNIRYGKMTLALIAQAAVNNFRKKLSPPYEQWTVEHIANAIFSAIDGDIRVKDDTIIVTFYNVPEDVNLRQHYERLPKKLEAENIDPRIPWLFDYKLNFRFK